MSRLGTRGSSWKRFVAGVVLATPLLTNAGCRSVQKEAGFFRVTASGFNILFFTIPTTNFEIVRDRMQREVGDTAQVTNIRRSGSLPPWWNIFNQILGIEIIEVYGTY